MAEVEPNAKRAAIFERLVQAEMRHASRWAEKLGIDPSTLEPSRPGARLRVSQIIARMFGTNRIIPWLLRDEDKDIRTYAADPEAQDFAREERRHGRMLRDISEDDSLLSAVTGSSLLRTVRGESGHVIGNSGTLRAAVLGVNDGLVSNFSLVMGVAGGTGRADFVLLAGIAGLLAGAFSMAAGEYISMRSQRDVYERQIEIEKAELLESPEEEEEELVLIYEAKGLPREDAERVAKSIMARPQVALDTMAREELGLDPDELGSPWGAALSSFVAFVAGAIVPILPYIFNVGGLVFTPFTNLNNGTGLLNPYIFDAGSLTGGLAFVLSAVFSGLALLLIGGALSFVSGKNVAWGAFRMLFVGGIAAAVTFGVGKLIGVSVAG